MSWRKCTPWFFSQLLIACSTTKRQTDVTITKGIMISVQKAEEMMAIKCLLVIYFKGESYN